MNEILYLCDNFMDNGLVLAQELPEWIYSPGKFYASIESENKELIITVVDENIERNLHLKIGDNNGYICNTEKYGIIEFVRQKTKYRYTGINKMYSNKYFNVIKPLNVKKIEDLCKKYNFYLVGKLFNE